LGKSLPVWSEEMLKTIDHQDSYQRKSQTRNSHNMTQVTLDESGRQNRGLRNSMKMTTLDHSMVNKEWLEEEPNVEYKRVRNVSDLQSTLKGVLEKCRATPKEMRLSQRPRTSIARYSLKQRPLAASMDLKTIV